MVSGKTFFLSSGKLLEEGSCQRFQSSQAFFVIVFVFSKPFTVMRNAFCFLTDCCWKSSIFESQLAGLFNICNEIASRHCQQPKSSFSKAGIPKSINVSHQKLGSILGYIFLEGMFWLLDSVLLDVNGY